MWTDPNVLKGPSATQTDVFYDEEDPPAESVDGRELFFPKT